MFTFPLEVRGSSCSLLARITKVVQQSIYGVLSLTGRAASGDIPGIQRNASMAIGHGRNVQGF